MINAKKNTVLTLFILAGCLMLGYIYSLFFNAAENLAAKPANGISIVTNKPIKDYFEEYRLERDRYRSKQVELLRELVNSPNSLQETRKEAQKKLLILIENMDIEFQIENVLVARGFKDAVVFMRPDSATVVINASSFLKEDTGKLKEIVSQFADISTENIIILPHD